MSILRCADTVSKENKSVVLDRVKNGDVFGAISSEILKVDTLMHCPHVYLDITDVLVDFCFISANWLVLAPFDAQHRSRGHHVGLGTSDPEICPSV